MEKIKIMTDSACDISPEQEKEHDIKIMCFPITLGDKGFMERIDLTNEQFYEMIEASEELPKTAQVTVPRFEEAYKEVMDEGYTDLIYISIASKGSNTNASAHMAMNNFYEEYPEAKDKFRIHIVDSKNYTGVYGYPVIQAAIKVSKGDADNTEIVVKQDNSPQYSDNLDSDYSTNFSYESDEIESDSADEINAIIDTGSSMDNKS